MGNRLHSKELAPEHPIVHGTIPIIASINGHAQAVVVIVSKDPLDAIMGNGHRPARRHEADQFALPWQPAA